MTLLPRTEQVIDRQRQEVSGVLRQAFMAIERRQERFEDHVRHSRQLLAEFDPRKVLSRGYALVRGTLAVGEMIEIEKSDKVIKAEVRNVSKKA